MSDEFEKCTYKHHSLANKYVFKTPCYIEDISQFQKLLDVCEDATEHDSILVNVFCYGGSAHVAQVVYNALRMTKATVYTVNLAVAYSGGSVILLAGDYISYHPFACTMAHSAKWGQGYDTHAEQVHYAMNSDIRIKDFYKEVYTGFLTEEEIEDLIKGTPLYIRDRDHDDRLNNLMKHREKEVQEYLDENEITEDILMKKTKKELADMILGK